MNITQSLSSLSSWSSTSSNPSFNSLLCCSTGPNLSTSMTSNLQLNQIQQQQQQQQQQSLFCPSSYLLQTNTPQQQLQQQQNYQQNINQLAHYNLRRPITGTRNFPVRSKMVVPTICSSSTTNFLASPIGSSSLSSSSALYSRKVFVGGLPPDIDEDEIVIHFRIYGQLNVDWPHKAESKSVFPPKGYAFLIFDKEKSVQELINSCVNDKDKYYISISSSSVKDKPVQIRPWCLNDSDYVLDNSQPIDPRKTIFVGGVPRPLKSIELAMIMNRLYGGVCYAGIDTDNELKYPKGAGRVAFSNQQSYVSAISARFVQLQHGEIDKRAEIKPYVLDDQTCDICSGTRCGGKFAPFFCANISCLQYYCESCWGVFHSKPGRDFHKPLVKEGADRPRTIPFRWC